MKNELLIEDLFEGEDDALGRELFGALGKLRAEPEDFAAGVAKRIRAAGEEAGSQDDLEVSVPGFARRAAAFLPPVLLPKGLAKMGVGGTLATKASFKFLPGVLALPVISVLMILVTLALGLKSVFAGGAADSRQNAAEAKYEVFLWWRRFWLPVGACVALGLYLLLRAPGEGFALLFLISTLGFLGVHAALVRRGLATRREVGRLAAGALGWLVGLSFQFSLGDSSWVGEHMGGWLVPLVLMGGVMACLALTGQDARKRERKAYRFRIGISVAVLITICAYAFEGGLGKVGETPATLRTWIEAGGDSNSVESLAETVACLEMAGEPAFDLTRVREVLRAQLELDVAGKGFKSLYTGAMIRLGAFDAADFERVADENAVERSLTWQSDRIDARSSMASLLAHQAKTPFTAEERKTIVAGVLAWVDPLDEYANIRDVLDAIHLFEGLGEPEAAEQLAQDARTILQRTWTLDEDGRQGAFSAYPTDLKDENEVSHLYFGMCLDTAMAIDLMARFGVPEGIDLEALDRFLRAESAHYIGTGKMYAANAAAGRALLHTLPSWTGEDHSMSAFEILMQLRVLLAAVLLSGFAVLLTFLAPIQVGKRPAR